MSAASLSFGMEASQAALRLSPVRRLARAMAPAPGQGPSEQSMNRGSFRCELVGTGDAGAKVRWKLSAVASRVDEKPPAA